MERHHNVEGFDDAAMAAGPCDDGLFHFEQKHVFSTQNNPMCGITLPQWLAILSAHGRHIEWPYLLRVAFLTLSSLFTFSLGLIESLWYPSHVIDAIPLPEDPVFVIGHPRTGTTLLHNLLASDDDSFYHCTTFCAGFPSCFLWFEKWGKRLFSRAIAPTRPMDSMPLHFDLPQEDECATSLLSHGASYYLALAFMAQETCFRKFLTLAPEDGATPEDEARWTLAFTFLVKKLTLRSSLVQAPSTMRRRLLLKSPIHTARVPLLRKLFPKATFIYLHRDPYKVLQSSAHMANTAFWYIYLNTPTDEQVTEYTLWQFERMYDVYYAASRDASTGALAEDILEVAYTDLVSSTMPSLKRVYAHAGLAWTDKIEAKFEAQVAALAGYKVNEFVELPPRLRDVIQTRAAGYFKTFGYAT
ncbi:hypothetical protein SPRG_11321 [Saprolegnia parasitica CBS 223.65]|uniref:Sulfotransferase domain-containing protein n=1 Tax=Saprolegnia parasitica (strain CBS 223.65) TaxID=695850 RepID=A0A067BV16_SAPPC|nr:hypothetical protein SPRG_11321 [Saprolegnia parasitica CBS 223.65]KDO22369.1 hypothetical protein SPRG_11321 [Saprolegnia parasitica CBS 223.65]|eukprot:XP_012206893.1 hypothetical protein SPRG_11321 [Saprolegnia parasitica CBS 223.65]